MENTVKSATGMTLEYYGIKLLVELTKKYGLDGIRKRSDPIGSVVDGARNGIKIVRDVLWKCIIAARGSSKIVMPCGKDDIYYRAFWPKVRVYRFKKQGKDVWVMGKLK